MIVPQSAPSATMMVDRVYYPLNAVRCCGVASYRSQAVRDYACLLDTDDDVKSWRCLPILDGPDGIIYTADFLVKRNSIVEIVDVKTASRPIPGWVREAILAGGYDYHVVDSNEYPANRLTNARDLLRYARYEVNLSDRVRLLAALDEQGSLTVGECLTAFQTAQPMAAIASMILRRLIDVDLDDGIIGPDTIIRRKRG